MGIKKKSKYQIELMKMAGNVVALVHQAMKENIKVRFKEVFTKLLKENVEDSLLSFNPPTVDKLLEFNISDNTYTIFADGKIALSKSDKYNSFVFILLLLKSVINALAAFINICFEEKKRRENA